MTKTWTRVLVLACLAVLAIACAGAPPAAARDSEAPPGAADRWLPCDDWVMFHWLPFEEERLYERLGLSRGAVAVWLRQDRYHTLAQLSIGRGLDVDDLIEHLVAPWGSIASPARRAILRERTRRTLTQGHLSQHVLFHTFHQPAIAVRADDLFGVAPIEYRDLRLQGISPAAIGRGAGHSPREVARRTDSVLRAVALKGVRSQAMPAGQAVAAHRRQLAGLDYWVRSRIAKPGHRRHGAQREGLSAQAQTCRLFSGRYEAARHRRAPDTGPAPAFALRVSVPWPGAYAALPGS